MPTDLETSIREALHARAAEVVPRQTSLRTRHGRRWMPPALAAAAVVALALTISLVVARRSDDTAPVAGSPAAAVVGYTWQLVRVADDHTTLDVPSRLRATLAFEPGGHLQGDDSVNALCSTYRLDARGSTSSAIRDRRWSGCCPVIMTATWSLQPSVRSSTSPTPDIPTIPATVQGSVLTVHARGYTLTLQRGHAVRR